MSSRFLSGQGEMTSLTRLKDWSNTSLGPFSEWPQSLRTTLSNLLASRFPMFLWWGPELLCFYNDAYRPSLGQEGKHPGILGQPAEQAWPEIWPVIRPLIDQVLSGGESTWSEDQLIPIYRNGKLENVYWTFSYSAVRDDSDQINGVLVTCFETTGKVIIHQELTDQAIQQEKLMKSLEENKNQFHHSVMQAPVAICIFRGPQFIIEMANEKMLELWGKREEQVLGKYVFDGVPEAAAQGFEQILDNVFTKGQGFGANEVPVRLARNGIPSLVYVNFLYEPLYKDGGITDGIIAVATEVTETVLAQKKIKDMEERSRLAVEAGQLGTFDVNMLTGDIVCSKRFYQIFGRIFSDRQQDYFSTIHPDDLAIQNIAFAQGLETGKLAYETRIQWKD